MNNQSLKDQIRKEFEEQFGGKGEVFNGKLTIKDFLDSVIDRCVEETRKEIVNKTAEDQMKVKGL